MDCPFCSIANHSTGAEILYETDEAISFLDHRPIAKGHALVASKAHYHDIYDIKLETLYEVYRIAQIISRVLRDLYRPEGVNLIQNNGENAGQTVFHFHVHIIPRYDSAYNKVLEKVARKRVQVDESVLAPIGNHIRERLKSLR
jgi:histidine triad (HIT) family protein